MTRTPLWRCLGGARMCSRGRRSSRRRARRQNPAGAGGPPLLAKSWKILSSTSQRWGGGGGVNSSNAWLACRCQAPRPAALHIAAQPAPAASWLMRMNAKNVGLLPASDLVQMDLRRAMAGQAAQRAQQEGGHLMTAQVRAPAVELRSRPRRHSSCRLPASLLGNCCQLTLPSSWPCLQMREREERRRAEAYGSVPIRLYLPEPSGLCLQTSLPATAPLSSLLELAKLALLPAAAAAGPYLFTTPPRTVLQDLSVSLYAAKLVPAAKVHLGLDASKAPAGGGQQLISPEALALVEAPPDRAAVMHAKQRQAAGAGVSASQPQKGVPKWMKLSGK